MAMEQHKDIVWRVWPHAGSRPAQFGPTPTWEVIDGEWRVIAEGSTLSEAWENAAILAEQIRTDASVPPEPYSISPLSLVMLLAILATTWGAVILGAKGSIAALSYTIDLLGIHK